MKTNTRFIQSVINASKSADVIMPWVRGKRRNTFIASRTAHQNGPRTSVA